MPAIVIHNIGLSVDGFIVMLQREVYQKLPSLHVQAHQQPRISTARASEAGRGAAQDLSTGRLGASCIIRSPVTCKCSNHARLEMDLAYLQNRSKHQCCSDRHERPVQNSSILRG